MLGLSGIRIGIYAAVAVLVGYLMWREHSLTRKLAVAHIETAQANANLAALQAAQAHERKIANEASADYERRLRSLDVERESIPTRSVRLCRSPTGYVPAPTTTASGVSETNPAGLPLPSGYHPGYGNGDRWGDAGPDIGKELYAEADRANEIAARCNSLIKWVESR